MKRIAFVALLSAVIAAPAFAGKNSIGVNYGTDNNGVYGIQGEFDISSAAKAPIAVQAFYKTAPQTFYGINVNNTALGVLGVYDFTSVFKLGNSKVKPFAGVGFERVTSSVVVPGLPAIPPFFAGTPSQTVSASKTELCVTAGVRYSLTSEFDVGVNYATFGGLTLGANYNF